VRDVISVLENRPDAPVDLREKALTFAARILAWDPGLGELPRARQQAETLLASGAALNALNAIVEAQGRRGQRITPALLTHVVRADKSGRITGLNGFAIGGIARRAGAPSDLGAGVDLQAGVGDEVRPGDPLLVIHASGRGDLEQAAALASVSSGFTVEH
jgi:thymidine phosphorylase